MSELISALDALSATDRHGIPETVLLSETELLLEARARIDGLLAHNLQALDARDVTVTEHGRQTKSWLIEIEWLSPREAAQRVWVARRLPTHPQLATALLAGEISHDHAQVILGCLDKLPAEWREAAETELIDFARTNDPALLGRLCRELRVRSGADEDAEAAEQRRHASRWATLSTTFDGMMNLQALLDPEAGAILQAALAPLLTPAGTIDERTVAQRRADALTELARIALNVGELPDLHGDRPQVVITIPWKELLDPIAATEIGHALINGQPISAAAARRYACDAGIIPAVLGGNSEILDLGRSTPTWSRAQRRAAALRDQGCVFTRCQAPLSRCQLHHLKFWAAHHGPTDHNNNAYVCPFHHWLVHHTNWTITRNPDGTIEIRRT